MSRPKPERAPGGWTYCADRQPPKRGRYEVAVLLRPILKTDRLTTYRLFAWWQRRPGDGWTVGHDLVDGDPYAWRPIEPQEPPFRRRDISFVAFPADWWAAGEPVSVHQRGGEE